MIDQYFGHKELYEVVLRAKEPMWLGVRKVEANEPVLYFNNVNMSLLTESTRVTVIRGGWANLPRIVWEEKGELQFQMTEGVMSSVGMAILMGAKVASPAQLQTPTYINMREGPLTPFIIEDDSHVYQDYPVIEINHEPVLDPVERKLFIFEYDRNAIQKKVYGRYFKESDDYDAEHHRFYLSEDKNFTIPAKNNRKYVVDYYYKYKGSEEDALIYTVEDSRFNGLFTLEAKFYSKDENEGNNYTNILYMPKVKIVSDINLRLGERADPTVSTFNIIGMSEAVGDSKNMILSIQRFNGDLNAEL